MSVSFAAIPNGFAGNQKAAMNLVSSVLLITFCYWLKFANLLPKLDFPLVVVEAAVVVIEVVVIVIVAEVIIIIVIIIII